MKQMIPEKYADLLDKPAFGNLGTLMWKLPKTERTTTSTNSQRSILEIQFTLSGNPVKCG